MFEFTTTPLDKYPLIFNPFSNSTISDSLITDSNIESILSELNEKKETRVGFSKCTFNVTSLLEKRELNLAKSLSFTDCVFYNFSLSLFSKIDEVRFKRCIFFMDFEQLIYSDSFEKMVKVSNIEGTFLNFSTLPDLKNLSISYLYFDLAKDADKYFSLKGSYPALNFLTIENGLVEDFINGERFPELESLELINVKGNFQKLNSLEEIIRVKLKGNFSDVFDVSANFVRGFTFESTRLPDRVLSNQTSLLYYSGTHYDFRDNPHLSEVELLASSLEAPKAFLFSKCPKIYHLHLHVAATTKKAIDFLLKTLSDEMPALEILTLTVNMEEDFELSLANLSNLKEIKINLKLKPALSPKKVALTLENLPSISILNLPIKPHYKSYADLGITKINFENGIKDKLNLTFDLEDEYDFRWNISNSSGYELNFIGGSPELLITYKENN